MEAKMRKSLVITIAAAALIAGAGLATAQQTEREPGRTPKATQGPSQGHPGATQSPNQSQAGAAENKEHRSGQSGAMQSPAQGRSGAVEKKERHSGQSEATQSPDQGRSGAVEKKKRPSAQSGATQSPDQGRTGAVEKKERPSAQSGAMQGPAQGRSGAGAASQQNTGVTEQRSVAAVNLSSDQSTKLHETITAGNLRRVDHVDFSLSTGTRIPSTVRMEEIPESIVDIVPQYRGFDYMVVGEELVIVDPGTLQIVAVQSGAGQGPVQRFGSEQNRGQVMEHRSVGSVTLSPDQRTRLHQTVIDGKVRRVDDADFALSVGTRVPDTVTVYDVPETIVDIVPEYRGYDYIVVRDELVIVDPDTLEIVAVLPD
ncbi:MAG TPA: DUF1236 domain-containing protein [Verrucomicrobiae bacterium]|nr:DUF1236 domain-containing protein [Verrucomicrobiae bacterium]